MRMHRVRSLRNHLHAIIIVPLVIIVMTWPTFPRLFDGDDTWLHVDQRDKWLRFWDAWHLERVLSGQTDLYYTDSMFHPHGTSLAFQSFSLAHALLLLALQTIMPAFEAYNLLFLLILAFNAFCAYVLIQHLLKDKWIAVYGAVVVAVSLPFPHDSTVPDLITIGSLPLTLYFFHRSVLESRWLFAVVAGLCAGLTTFISLYIFAFILLTVAIYAFFLAILHCRQAAFWPLLLTFIVVCGSISFLRLYPIFANAAVLREGVESYRGNIRSNDLLSYFVLTRNPFTGHHLQSLFSVPPGSLHKDAYLGYINLFFLGCAFLNKPLRRRLTPWLAILVVFAVLRLGHYLTFNSVEFPSVVLLERVLSDRLPALFGTIGMQEYYQFGVVIPLAVLSCFGLAALVRSKPAEVRVPVVLVAMLVVALEFYVPLEDDTLEQDKTEFVDWLQTESANPVKLINLPQGGRNPHYYLYLQTLTDFPQAYGFINRTPHSASTYINSNLFLRSWDESRSVHCLPHNQEAYISALDQLLDDGFTHVVVHGWLYGDQFIDPSFWNVPASYDDGFVTVYRLSDLRLSCQPVQVDIPYIDHFLRSSLLIPGQRSSILSFHPSERIEDKRFSFLDSLFSDWHSYVHLYFDDGELTQQSPGDPIDLAEFAQENQIITVIYDSTADAPAALESQLSLGQFESCQRAVHEDGSVTEVFVSREFSCALVVSVDRFQVQYENGARLENLMHTTNQDVVDFQFFWSALPPEPHSISIQVFDSSGAKVLGQDTTIAYATLTRQQIDVSSLPPADYVVKLIAYDYNTGQSTSGATLKDGANFERELEIASISRTRNVTRIHKR